MSQQNRLKIEPTRLNQSYPCYLGMTENYLNFIPKKVTQFQAWPGKLKSQERPSPSASTESGNI